MLTATQTAPSPTAMAVGCHGDVTNGTVATTEFERADLLEADSWLGVEVEAQLVGRLGALGEVRPDVEAEAGEVHVQATCAMSASTSAREVVPFGVETTVVCSPATSEP